MVQITAAFFTLLVCLTTQSLAAPAEEITKRCTAPAVNAATLTLVENSEGWRAAAYKDPVGKWTIGFGHLCSKTQCTDVSYPKPLSKANGAKLLQSDLLIARNCITQKVSNSVTLNANQYGALVDWAFNEGCGNVASSNLIKRLNKKENPNTVAAQELPKWVYAGGKKLPGLVTRRANEVKLFKTASSVKAHPC